MKAGKSILSLIILLCAAMPIKGQSVQDTIANFKDEPTEVFSILTCSPGEEIYALFGHTAIRYRNIEKGTDIVFNYGIFSFNTPNFIWRFVKGDTDYMLGITSYEYFHQEYYDRNSYVYEQKINLTREQTEYLFQTLANDYKPENRVYRYNFFYNNCTTRAKEKIEEAFNGEIIYDKEMPELTFRDIVHQYTNGHEWSELGIDLCIASPADKPISKDEMMFAPFYYKDLLSNAVVSGTGKHVAQEAKAIVIPDQQNITPDYPSPLLCFSLLFVITLIISVIEHRTKKVLWGYDIILFGGAGISGLIIAFLAFISTHPAVSHNYHLFFMHPAHLVLLPFVIYKEIKHKASYYHILNAAAIIIFFLALPIIPQKFNTAILLLALSLLSRSLLYIYKFRQNK